MTDATNKKISWKLELKCAVNILIDTRTVLNDVNKVFQNRKLKWKLSNLRHQGTYTPTKMIIVIYDKNLVKINDLKIIKNGQMFSFKLKINNDCVNFPTVYATPEDDNPEFFLKAKEEFDSIEGDLASYVVTSILLVT